MSKSQSDEEDQQFFDPTEANKRSLPQRVVPSSNVGTVILAVAMLSAFCHMAAIMYLESVPVLASNPLYQDLFTPAELETGKQVAQRVTALAIAGYILSVACSIPLAIKGIVHRYL